MFPPIKDRIHVIGGDQWRNLLKEELLNWRSGETFEMKVNFNDLWTDFLLVSIFFYILINVFS